MIENGARQQIASLDGDVDSPPNPASHLTTVRRGDLLNRAMVIRGTFAAGKPMLAVPNHARLNRGDRSIAHEAEGGPS